MCVAVNVAYAKLLFHNKIIVENTKIDTAAISI